MLLQKRSEEAELSCTAVMPKPLRTVWQHQQKVGYNTAQVYIGAVVAGSVSARSRNKQYQGRPCQGGQGGTSRRLPRR